MLPASFRTISPVEDSLRVSVIEAQPYSVGRKVSVHELINKSLFIRVTNMSQVTITHVTLTLRTEPR